MKITYELQVKSKCPVDGYGDYYYLQVLSDKTVPVEQILMKVTELENKEMYQEDYTVFLHRSLMCSVKTIGYHSGVKTTVEI